MSAKIMQLVSDLVGQGRWDEAYTTLSRYLSQDPQNAQVHYQLGLLSYNLGQFPQAETHLRNSLKLREDVPDCHYYLGLVLLKTGRAAEAMAEFRESCERRAGFATGHLHWGIALSCMGSYRGALGQFNQAVKFNSQMPAAYYQSGLASYHLGLYPQAIEYFKTAASLDKTFAEAYNGWGLSLMAQGQVKEAKPIFEQSWNLNYKNATTARNWGRACMLLGEITEAREHFEAVTKIDPNYLSPEDGAAALNDWGLSLVNSGELDAASEKFSKAIEIEPNAIDARVNLALTLNNLKRYEEAAQSLAQAIQNNPNEAILYFYSAVCYLLAGQYQSSVDALNAAQSKGYSDPQISLWKGYAQMGLGNTEVAERQFDTAVQSNPNNYLAYDAWGCCLEIQKKHELAEEKFQKSLQIKSAYGLGHLHLAQNLEVQNRIDESNLEYRRAVEQDPSCLEAQKENLHRLLDHAKYDLVLSKSALLLSIVPEDLNIQLAMAMALKFQNRLLDAIPIVNKILAQQPDCGPALSLQGQIFLVQGNLAEADDQFRNASVAYDGDATLYYAWGKTLSLLGFYEMALDKFQKSCELDPRHGDSYEAWGATLKALGRFQEAAEVFKRASEFI